MSEFQVGDRVRGRLTNVDYTVMYLLADEKTVIVRSSIGQEFVGSVRNYTKLPKDPHQTHTIMAYHANLGCDPFILYIKDSNGGWHRISTYPSDATKVHKEVAWDEIADVALQEMTLIPKAP